MNSQRIIFQSLQQSGIFLRLSIPLALAACAAPGPPVRDIPGDVVFLADGSRAYSITCNGGWGSFSDCIGRAGEICREDGYEQISHHDVFYDWNRGEIIKCRTPDGLYPGDENIPPAD